MTEHRLAGRTLRRLLWLTLASSSLLACESDDKTSSASPSSEDASLGDAGALSPLDGSTALDELSDANVIIDFRPAAEAGTESEGGSPYDGGQDGDGVDRDVLRPEQRSPSEERIRSLKLTPGFQINVFAKELKNARMLAVHKEHVYLTRREQDDVLKLVDANLDGVAEQQVTVAQGLDGVHGIAVFEPYVYLATNTTVYRAALQADGTLGTPEPIIRDLPAGGQHPNRTLAVGPDQKLYITVGSPCDACPIDNPEYATVLRAALDGTSREIVAKGLRNTIGFGWHPVTGELWGLDHGSDFRGDDVPPEELNRIEAGKDYGWPYCYGNRQIDPIIQDPPMATKEAYCAPTTPPVLTSQAHEAPIGFAFYTAAQFPEAYRNSAFVAFRGSWNRIPATGYRIARVVFEAGQPARIEDFVSGFLIENGTAQFGRLAGLTVHQDGSLLFTDDENGVIYRVRYVAPAP
jgi:glucose/arabinose dehydrogenase